MKAKPLPLTPYDRIWQFCGCLVVIISGGALSGWFIGSATLRGISASFIPMAPNTALVFLLLGMCLVIESRKSSRLTRGAAVLTAILVLARLSEYLTATDLRVDHWFFSFPAERLGLAPVGKMAFFTAITFLLLSSALLLMTWPERRWTQDTAKVLSVVVAFIGIAFLLGYLYGAPLMYGGRSIPMALNTAMGFFITGTGLLIRGSVRDIMERRQAKEALQKAHDELETRVDERTRELSKTVALLQAEIAEREQVRIPTIVSSDSGANVSMIPAHREQRYGAS